eukprot:scaffold676_cov137-Skeletonema_marinoi.AAC.6
MLFGVSTYNQSNTKKAEQQKQTMIPTLFILLFIAPFVHFVDATAAATSVGGRAAHDVDSSYQDEGTRQFIEKDYLSLMTNYVNDQRYLRGRKLQENIDYQKQPYYQSQQQTHGASRAQAIILTIVVTLTIALAVYAAFLYREFAAVTLYNVLGYRLFGDSDVQGGSGEQEGVEIS